jgi:hypothetical protein
MLFDVSLRHRKSKIANHPSKKFFLFPTGGCIFAGQRSFMSKQWTNSIISVITTIIIVVVVIIPAAPGGGNLL